MANQNFSVSFLVDQRPGEVFSAINNVKAWWTENLEGNSQKLNDEFEVRFGDVHYSRQKLIEVVPNKKVVWLVTDSKLNFLKDKSEWTGTKISFEIAEQDKKTQFRFTHLGLVPEIECYSACSNAWSDYINHSLRALITESKEQLKSNGKVLTIKEVAARFNELAQQEKWFEIQDELFADNVKSIEPSTAKYLPNAEGKLAVRKKGEDWVKRVEAAHKRYTSEPMVAANHFVIRRDIDITVRDLGRIQFNELILYEVSKGKIISEQFFY